MAHQDWMTLSQANPPCLLHPGIIKKIAKTTQCTKPDSRRGDSSRVQQVSQERVGSSNCVHTTTHAMFVDEPRGNGEASRGRRAPLAQQEFEVSSHMPPVSWIPGLAWDCRYAGEDCCDRSPGWRPLNVPPCGNQSRLPLSGNLYSLQSSSKSEPFTLVGFLQICCNQLSTNQHTKPKVGPSTLFVKTALNFKHAYTSRRSR